MIHSYGDTGKGLALNKKALIMILWYTVARAAPMKGPTHKIHCNTKKTNN